MKSTIALFALIALIAIASAFPSNEGPSSLDIKVKPLTQPLEGFENMQPHDDSVPSQDPEPHQLVREKRATCDLLSAGGKVQHSACAAHCIILRKRGGYCNSQAVCVCRN